MIARKKTDAQMTEISVSADEDFGETKMTETTSERRTVGRYVFRSIRPVRGPVNALARQVFHGINPAAGETIQQFATRLKKAALDCANGTETDNNIRDAILWKCPSTYIKRQLLE